MIIFLDNINKFLPYDVCPINQKTINNIHFTNREIDVVACLLGGRSTKKTASFLLISPKTVENHIHNIMLKLGCNSRENIIDHLEKSENFPILKEHYARILIKIAFELELKKIAILIKKKDITCLNLYYTKQQDKPPFLSHLEKHLELASIKVYSIPLLDTHQQNICLPDTVKSQFRNNLVYNVLSSEFLEQFTNSGFILNLEGLRLNSLIDKSLDIVFLLSQTPNSIITYIKKNFPSYTDIVEQTNYYFLILEILKIILSNNIDVEKNIVEFKRQHEILLNPTFSRQQSTEEDLSREASINHTFKYYNKKLIILIGTIILLLIIYIGFFILDIKKETLFLKSKLQKSIIFSKNFIEKTSIQTKFKEKSIILNLPPRNNKFIGREHNLTQIQEQLHSQKVGTIPQQAIVGLGGIGKTQLVTEFAYRAAEAKHYEAILWVTAETTSSINNAYKKIAGCLEINTENLNFHEIQKFVHKYLAAQYNGSKILFILDNVQNYKDIKNYIDLIREQSNFFTPHILITSRSQNWTEIPLILDTFTSQEALIFIKKQLPNANETSITNLSKVLNYFPLALSQAVAYIKAHTNIEDYLEAYTIKTKDYLNEFSNNQDQYAESLWATWNISLSKLSQNAQKILFIAAFLDPDDIPIEFFSDLSITAKMEAIEDLRKHSLIILINNRSFKVHRLLQEVIRLANKDNFKRLLRSDYLNEAMALLEDKFDFNYLEYKKWNEWEKYLTNAKIIAEHAIKTQDKLFDRGMKLYAKVAMFMTYVLITYTEETAQIWLKLLQLTEKYHYNQSNSLLTASINTHLGVAKHITAKIDEAKMYFNQAIEAYSHAHIKITKREKELINILRLIPLTNNIKLSDEVKYDLGYTLTQLGNIFNYELVEPNMAVSSYNKSITIFSEIENINAIKNSLMYQQVDTLNRLITAHISLGNLIQAETLLKTTKELADQMYVDHRQQAFTYLILAHFYTHIGKFKEADQLFKQAFSILSVSFSNKQFFINISKIYIGSNNYMLGNIKHARTLLEEAIPYLDDSDSGYWHWFPRLHLARVYEQAGEYDKALMFIRESLILAKKFYKEKLHDSMAFQLSRAETWRKLYKTTSMTYWKEKLELTIQLFGKNHHQTARYHQLYGQALANRQQLKAAKEQYEKAMAILDKEEIKHPALIKFHQQNMQILQELIKESKV